MRQPESFLSEVEVPTDMLASLLMEQGRPTRTEAREAYRLRAKVYGVMGVTTLLTFVALSTGYQFFFPHQLFA